MGSSAEYVWIDGSCIPLHHSDGEGNEGWYENDLHLAAELGKTLLERNQELESSLRNHQLVIDDQSRQIEFLTKQSVALRDANDSRLKLYESLESSVAELEKANDKLQHDSSADKKRIKSLCSSIDQLERKCEELQGVVEEMRTSERDWKRRFDSSSDSLLRRVVSMETFGGASDEQSCWFESPKRVDELERTVRELKTQNAREAKRIEQMELNVTSLVQENDELRDQVSSLKQRESVVKALEEELHSLAEICQTKFSCRCTSRSVSSVEGDYDVDSDDVIEPDDVTAADVIVQDGGQHQQGESLLSELDAQYRVLIEKYEALLEARVKSIEDGDSLLSSLSSDGSASPDSTKQPSEDGSDSGVSSSNATVCDKSIQTESGTTSELESSSPIEKHFSHTPQYKKLFEDIFNILKKETASNDKEREILKQKPSGDIQQVTSLKEPPVKTKSKQKQSTYKKLISTTLSSGRFYLDLNLDPDVTDRVRPDPESSPVIKKSSFNGLFGHLSRTYVHSKLRQDFSSQGKSYAQALSNA